MSAPLYLGLVEVNRDQWRLQKEYQETPSALDAVDYSSLIYVSCGNQVLVPVSRGPPRSGNTLARPLGEQLSLV